MKKRDGIKGVTRCPRCGSRRTMPLKADRASPGNFYSQTLRRCLNPACEAIWEPFAEADLSDPSDRLSAFKSPCNNCAFRPGSPELQNPETWAEIKQSIEQHNGFYCHKGVPIAPESEHGFAYPKERWRLRLCRGWLNAYRARQSKADGEGA